MKLLDIFIKSMKNIMDFWDDEEDIEESQVLFLEYYPKRSLKRQKEN